MTSTTFTAMSLLNFTRGTWRQYYGIFLLCALSFTGAAHAQPELRCEVTYAGTTHVLKAQPVQDPYSVEAVDIGGRFLFKMVMVGRETQLAYINLYVYLQQEPRPVIVQEVKYLPPFRNTPKPFGFTGEQHVYAGPIERELIYRCGLRGLPS